MIGMLAVTIRYRRDDEWKWKVYNGRNILRGLLRHLIQMRRYHSTATGQRLAYCQSFYGNHAASFSHKGGTLGVM